MRTLLIVITASAIILGLWTWIAWSLAIAVTFLVRAVGIVALVFLVQGAIQTTGRTQHFCRGAAIGLGFALFHASFSSFAGARWGTVLWMLVNAPFCTLVGGWAGLRASAWWKQRGTVSPRVEED